MHTAVKVSTIEGQEGNQGRTVSKEERETPGGAPITW